MNPAQKNPWLGIALSDYEDHMSAETVGQMQMLSHITARQLFDHKPSTVAIFGVAGGNGLEHIDTETTTKVYGIDVNEEYLRCCRERHRRLDGILQTMTCNLADEQLTLPAVELLIANLVVEYLGVTQFAALLQHNQELIKSVSCTIQQNNGDQFVSSSKTGAKLAAALDNFHYNVEEKELRSNLEASGFIATKREIYSLPNDKEFVRMDFSAKRA